MSSPQSLALSHDGRMVAVADTGNNREGDDNYTEERTDADRE